jgi:hypothetical protein
VHLAVVRTLVAAVRSMMGVLLAMVPAVVLGHR